MEAIHEKHRGLIDCLTKLYSTLVTMQYISASDIRYPPHTDPEIAMTDLQALGFEAEVLDLVQILPALRNEVTWGWQERGTELMPRSRAVNYFNSPDDAGSDLIHDLRRGDYSVFEEAVMLHPWMLRLTDGGDYGTHLIYDTRDRTIIEWTYTSGKYWYDTPSRPCETVFSEIQTNLESLEWVPYDDPYDEDTPRRRQIMENPVIFQNIWARESRYPTDVHAAAEKTRELDGDGAPIIIRQINSWRAQQTLYRDSGWGSPEGFDGELYRTKRLDFIARLRALDHELVDIYDGLPVTGDKRQRFDEFNQRYYDFLTQVAGENAV